MRSTVGELYQFLSNDATLQAVENTVFPVYIAEAWNLPGGVNNPSGNVIYPAMTFKIDVRDIPIPSAIVDRENGTIRLWYVTQSSKDACWAMRDAIFAKMHKQQESLRSQGVLHVNWIEHIESSIGAVPGHDGLFQCYTKYHFIS